VSDFEERRRSEPAQTPDWASSFAPSLDDFEVLARAAFERLPEQFRGLCSDLVIQVVDFADAETLAYFGMQSPYELLGLYNGRALTEQSVFDAGDMPAQVFLYRRPILEAWAEGQETLGHLVTHVLVHEIGHHFGLSDDAMHALEEEAERESPWTGL